jgi:hypothetical protein
MNRGLAVAIGLALAAQVNAQSTSSPVSTPYQSDYWSRFLREEPESQVESGLFVQPRIESALLFVGNINLAEDSRDEIDTAGVEAAPGIYASYLSPRAEGFIDYSLIGRAFEASEYDGVTNRLTASGHYVAVPEWFRIQGQATYSDAIIDPSRSYNYGGSGLFDPNNLSEVATASLSPDFSHEFQHFRLDAVYTYGRVWYLDAPDTSDRQVFSLYQDDSVDQQALVGISTRDADRGATARVYYEWQDSDFENTVDYRYERAGAEVGLRLTRTLQFVADGGAESDLDESTTNGGLDSSFWHTGLVWRPDEKTKVEARYGDRFFGESWSARVSRDTKWVTVRLSYLEDPQIETRRIGINFDPNEFPILDPGSLSGFTSYPFVGKDAIATVLAEGARTKIRLDLYDRKKDYIEELPPDEERTGVRFNAVRDIGADLYAEFDTRYEDSIAGRRQREQLTALQYHYYDWNVIGRLSWVAYRDFTVTGEAGYLHRSGDTNYDGEWLAFRFRYLF